MSYKSTKLPRLQYGDLPRSVQKLINTGDCQRYMNDQFVAPLCSDIHLIVMPDQREAMQVPRPGDIIGLTGLLHATQAIRFYLFRTADLHFSLVFVDGNSDHIRTVDQIPGALICYELEAANMIDVDDENE